MTHPPAASPRMSSASTLAPVARVLARDVVLPYLAYLGLHALGVSNVLALAAGAVVSAAVVAGEMVRHRRVDALALIVLVTLILAVVVSLISGNARVTLARDCLITGGLGVMFLASLTRRRPLVFHLLAPLAAARDPRGRAGVEDRFQGSSELRSVLRVSTAVWGLLLLADGLLRLLAALLLPVPQAATAATVLTIATVAVLVGWLRFYLPPRIQAGHST
jgi:hypothetical protein